ncbi:LuxR C-terminal-related transcriptional regulator [Mangrovimonas sp. AS39]|uniref:helix-turn-helix and ligand-binding sensor domain-containing protein n=1 Tax=Mangrovimonas futianensis TaxID=2895523 RepID=UPI001E2F4A18|nr:LuxR C-terminal-related transcriptional regulator [Mangrovimonas futianensis]MCF1190056.1 LuxR C-terminal-related transcriptional regulator [Mangrovimonas futianensis]MCF1194193.1 LuxR C-terminal-related transcriptional regulator [Mangrovimonas futianensis]
MLALTSNYKMNFRLCLVTFSLFLVSIFSHAQYTPYFKNYSISDYRAGNQNWGVAKGNSGKLYVANNEGLLEFDGMVWKFYEMPNKTIIRSVHVADGKIFTGSYEEFGYWEKNEFGVLAYTSLSSSLEEETYKDQEFWKILSINGQVLFQSFTNIYIYNDGELIKVDKKNASSTLISMDIVEGQVYVSTLKRGVFILDNNVLVPDIFDPLLVDTKVISILKKGASLYLFTGLKGCFIYSNGVLKPWNSEINDLLEQHQLNVFTEDTNGQMIFGTIKNGLYITDDRGNVLFHINKENGFINNTVLSLDYDGSFGLWCGLDNGLSYVELNANAYFYKDITGKLGAVYDVIEHEGVIYVGSNTGLFYLDEKGELVFIEDSQGQVWDLVEIEGQLFCGHNNGTFLVDNKTIVPLSNHTGGWVIKKVPEKNDLYIQGTYTGLVRYRRLGNEKWDVKNLGRTTIPSRFLVFENSNSAWVAHAYKGLYKVQFDSAFDTIKNITDYSKKGLLSDYNVRIYRIKNDIFFKTNRGWQKYEPLLDSIVPYKVLEDKLGQDAYIISEDDQEDLVIKDGREVIHFKSILGEANQLSITSSFLRNRLIVGYEKISRINDSISALNLNDGFLMINEQQFSANHDVEKPQLETLSVNRELVDIDKGNFDFPFKSNISLAFTSPRSKDYFFAYKWVNNDENQWYELENQLLEFSSLPDGKHTVLVKAVNSFGDESEPVEVAFVILPPWYKSSLGFGLYVILILVIIGFIIFFHRRKVSKEQRLMQEKFELEQEQLLKEKALENEKNLVELKNQTLKNEVKLKSKQLANTAMALVKKNETLQDLKKELGANKKEFGNVFAYKKLVKRIDGSIGHDDEWEIFEYNFNQVHEEFFKELKRMHPVLTQKDLKICAYIKMNLTTKEIAPLMNISVRGVETHRYRLKKKLDLDNDKSLTDYLMNIQ